jgi:hypothetical protein
VDNENTTLRTYLQDLLDVAEWNWLTDLAKQGKVLLLAPHLDLVEVGLALAEDDISQVQVWLDDSWIFRPEPEQIAQWDCQPEKRFASLIVQPFVLAKETPVISEAQ